jgi:hypothetical protein
MSVVVHECGVRVTNGQRRLSHSHAGGIIYIKSVHIAPCCTQLPAVPEHRPGTWIAVASLVQAMRHMLDTECKRANGTQLVGPEAAHLMHSLKRPGHKNAQKRWPGALRTRVNVEVCARTRGHRRESRRCEVVATTVVQQPQRKAAEPRQHTQLP